MVTHVEECMYDTVSVVCVIKLDSLRYLRGSVEGVFAGAETIDVVAHCACRGSLQLMSVVLDGEGVGDEEVRLVLGEEVRYREHPRTEAHRLYHHWKPTGRAYMGQLDLMPQLKARPHKQAIRRDHKYHISVRQILA